jgi:Ca2+:H+ antiporter
MRKRTAAPPSNRAAWTSFGLLLLSLITVVGLAKALSPTIEARHRANRRAESGARHRDPRCSVLLPETWAAVRAARANRLQSSMNLASRLGARVDRPDDPVVAVTAIIFELPLVMGLDPKDLVMLAVTFLVSTVTLGTGRTNMMQGAVHLVLFAAFLFLAFVP